MNDRIIIVKNRIKAKLRSAFVVLSREFIVVYTKNSEITFRKEFVMVKNVSFNDILVKFVYAFNFFY